MEQIFTDNYYTQGIWVILGGMIALYITANILWNRKLVPRRRAKGTPTAYFGNFFKRITHFAFKEDPRSLAPKKAPKLATKLLTLKTINWVLLLAGFALIGLQNLNAWIPFFVLIIVIAVQTTGPLAQRDRILNRMFAVASSGFRYGKGADLNPWGYVKIKKWETLTTPGETHISIPANWDSSSLAARDGFESHFNTTVTDENSWIYEWKTADGLVIARPISHLPQRATYPGSEKYPWHVIPLGLGAEGEVTVDLTKTPHMLVCGTTGSGKSVLQRNLIFHCIQHNDMWRFLGVDVKRVELKPFAKYSQTVLGIGTNLEDGVEIVRYAKEVMETRYEEMESKGVNHFSALLDANGKPPYAIMLMVDEAYMFMATEGAKTDEGKMRDQLHGDAGVMLGEIARLGRAAGIHLVLATQRPDATVIRGELKANLDIRIAAGRLDATPSSMVLDSGAATQLPGHIKGRGIVRFSGHQEQFQGYFAEQDWIDTWLEANPGVEPEIVPASKNRADENLSAEEELAEIAKDYNFDDGAIEIDGKMVSGSVSEQAHQEDLNQLEMPLTDSPLATLEKTPVDDQEDIVAAPPAQPVKKEKPKAAPVKKAHAYDDDEEAKAYLKKFGLLDDDEDDVLANALLEPEPVSTPEVVSEEPAPVKQEPVAAPVVSLSTPGKGGLLPPKPVSKPVAGLGALPPLPGLPGLPGKPGVSPTPAGTSLPPLPKLPFPPK